MTCACTVTTELFDLCPACSEKVWHQANVQIKAEKEGRVLGRDFERVGPEVFRSDGTWSKETQWK